jgi:hypothetical protein
LHTISVLGARYLIGKVSSRGFILGAQLAPLTIIEKLYFKKLSFRPSKWPQKLKTTKNSKLPKLPEKYFERVEKVGGHQYPPRSNLPP